MPVSKNPEIAELILTALEYFSSQDERVGMSSYLRAVETVNTSWCSEPDISFLFFEYTVDGGCQSFFLGYLSIDILFFGRQCRTYEEYKDCQK